VALSPLSIKQSAHHHATGDDLQSVSISDACKHGWCQESDTGQAAAGTKSDLHGDSRIEAQQSLGGLQMDGLQQDPLGLAVLAGIIQSPRQVQHDGGVVLVVLLQGGGIQLDGCGDLALG